MKKERIVKNPQVRKMEIITAAQKLFYSQGYDNTPINDILESTGIAKGTFYHYFKSKEELVVEMVNIVAQNAIEQIKQIVSMDISALEKLNRAFQDSQDIKAENPEAMISAFKVFYRDDNLILRIKTNEEITRQTTPYIAKIIEEGLKKREFHAGRPAQSPEEMAEVIMVLGIHMGSEKAKIILESAEDAPEKLKKNVQIFERSVERFLEIKPGSFQTVSHKTMQKFIQTFLKIKKRGNENG